MSRGTVTSMTERGAEPDDLYLFFGLACGITWVLDAPAAIAVATGGDAGPYLPFAGLGAFGPTIAAAICARRRGRLREVFGRWRPTSWALLLVAPFIPLFVHTLANLVDLALGSSPVWLHPPTAPEHVAGLVFFSIGEEFGWRGFAQERAERRWGRIPGSIVVGTVWALWHWVMFVAQGLDATTFFLGGVELAFFAIVFGCLHERSGRSMAVAIALHAGAHLDNPGRDPETISHLVIRMVVTIAFALAVGAWWRRANPTEH
jgi:uncharacterized protein